MKKNDGFTLIELLVTLVIVGVIMTFIISMMSSQYAIIRDVDAYLVMSSENKDVNDTIMREFIKAEKIWIDLDASGSYDADEEVVSSDFDISELSNNHALTDIQLQYVSDAKTTTVQFIKEDPSAPGTKENELHLQKTIEGSTSTTFLGDHLAPDIPAEVTFYRRLSLDRRVVALIKIKINYQHDGITKQYDLFYHLRNLQYPTN